MTDDTHNAPRGAPKAPLGPDEAAPIPRGAVLSPGPRVIGGGGDKNKVPPSPSASPLFGDSSVPSGSISASGPISAEPSFPTAFASSGGSFVTGDPSVCVTGPVSEEVDVSDIPESGEAFFRSAELRMPSLPLGGPIFAADGTDVSAQFTGGRFMCRAALPWAPGLTSPRTFVMHPDAARSAAGVVLCPHCGTRWEGWR